MFVRFDPLTVFRSVFTAMCTVPSSAENISPFAREKMCTCLCEILKKEIAWSYTYFTHINLNFKHVHFK